MGETLRNWLVKLTDNPLLVGLLFSGYAFLIRFFIYPKYSFLLGTDVNLIQSFIEWFGVAYGLFIALVLVNVWAQFDTTEREFDREADAIFMLYQSAKQITDMKKKIRELKEQIIEGIKRYVAQVTDHFQEEHQKPLVKEAGDKILEEVRDLIGQLVHLDEPDSITSELIEEFNEAVDLRGDRISHSRQHIPDPVWLISLASSILWLIPFYGLNFQNDGVAVALVGGVTVIVVAILVIIKDLDDPFEGTWKIDNSEWIHLAEKIDPKLTLFFVCSLNSNRSAAVWAWINQRFSRRLCALYSLLRNAQEREQFVASFAGSARIKMYHKDLYEQRYEKRDVLPVIICQSPKKRDVLINAAELRNVSTLAELKKLIEERMPAFQTQEIDRGTPGCVPYLIEVLRFLINKRKRS